MMAEPPEAHPLDEYEEAMTMPYRLLDEFQRQRLFDTSLRNRIQRVVAVMEAVVNHWDLSDQVCYLSENEAGGTDLLVSTYRLDHELSRILWQQRKGIILTSGTLAVGTDFSRFRQETGLAHNGRVVEAVAESPFDYASNCLLYLSKRPVSFRAIGNDMDGCYDRITAQIIELLDATSGHGLVLFTSYTMMEAVGQRLRQGFGRAIRTETDTCVVAVLDERCAPGKRYYADLLNALPDGIPETNESADITEFMLDKKHIHYFTEADDGHQK